MISNISSLIIPGIVLTVIIYGVKKKINVYDSFIEGAKESFDMIISLFPTYLAMILGINIIVNSGFITFILNFLKPIFEFLKVPLEIIPMALMRPISGSSSLALLNNIFATNGPDSLVGRIGSLIQGSTDTTFYVISLYFGSVGIKKIKYALWAGLFADMLGIISSIIIIKLLF